MADFDYRKYIDNQINETAPFGLKKAMDSVIRQYASTPEGQENLIRAGKTIVRYNPLRTFTTGNVINIAPEELSQLRYAAANGELHQASLNRAFAHEMGHVILKHEVGLRPVNRQEVLGKTYDQFRKPDMPRAADIPPDKLNDEIGKLWSRGVSIEEFYNRNRDLMRTQSGQNQAELETIKKFENTFMEKYYGEPRRNEDAYVSSMRRGGTPGLEFSQDITHNRHLLTEPDGIKEQTLTGQEGANRKPKPLIQLKP